MAIDNPRIKPQAEVKGPRAFKGAEFTHFPRLVAQMGRPRPSRAAVGGAARAGPPEGGSAEPKEGFARPLRGMGVGAYEGLREQITPQMQDYRTAVHAAYADENLTPEEKANLQKQRAGLRQEAHSYKLQHPLQEGLGAKLGIHKQLEQKGSEHTGDVVKTWPHSDSQPPVGSVWPHPDDGHIMDLFHRIAQGHMTPQEAIQLLMQRRANNG